ncbi:ABC transporter ATP-binding protein [Trueperella bernardiae]|uniref:ABC transporter transmembrane domain-containing protein n=1 Tax=Trueperella bernardiae TaxID=59561 RepID=UPI0025524706|nr:ABC transporter ATP-binding protein [Trueperella bernardiae]WIM08232.1 ABC transporter ATP-binding protein [Trueperella bernardiae]
MAKHVSSQRASRAINQRRFEVGPQPKRWPASFEMSAVPEMDPGRLLRSTLRANWQVLALATLLSMAAYGGGVFISWALGRALDSGIERGLTTSLLPGVALIFAAMAVRMIGAAAEPVLMVTELRAHVGWSLKMVERIAGVRGGGRAAIPSGEMVTAVTTDAQKLGAFSYMVADVTAAIFSFVLTVALMLRISVPLGLVVVIGVPVAIGIMLVFINPLQRRLDAQREERGKLTTLASDAVVGLRVLRGVGGEDIYIGRYTRQSEKVRETGIRAAALQSFLNALSAAVPYGFTVLIVGGGLWEVYSGAMTHGQLVSFYGYSMFMGAPIWMVLGFLQTYTDARVCAGRVAKVMAIEPLTSDDAAQPARAGADWSRAHLRDEATGVEIKPGLNTALVCSAPEVSAELLERLARTDDAAPVTARWEGEDSIPLTAFPLAEVRSAIVLSDAIAQLFQGRLRSNLEANNAAWPLPREVGRQMADTGDGSGVAHRDHKDNPVAIGVRELMLAMITADAADIVDSLEEGLDGYVAERGRSLSGGQRQRVALARAVLTEAPILLLVEPTSAVDSHTESRIAQRLRAAREGRTTAVVTTSPIVLGEADEVIFLGADGAELARGTHAELLDDPRYFDVVHREAR